MRVLSMLLLAASIVGLATGLSMCGQMEVVEAASKTARDSLIHLLPSGVVLGLAVVRTPVVPVLAASRIRRPPPAAPHPPHPARRTPPPTPRRIPSFETGDRPPPRPLARLSFCPLGPSGVD